MPTPQPNDRSRRDERESFTVAQFRQRTVGLNGHERLQVFGCLPDALQAEFWTALRERFDHVADLDFRDYCDGS